MSRIWSEPYDALRHQTFMPDEFGGGEAVARHHRSPTLQPHRVFLVSVAGFTFTFHTLDEIRACLAFYEQKIQPSGRSGVAEGMVARDEVAWRHEVQRWHERLPSYLREEPKRVAVVAALTEALSRAATGEI